MKLNEAQESSENSSSEYSSSDSVESDSENEIPMAGRDMFVDCVQLPDFLLTHAEYNRIVVPQIKNF